MFVKGSDFLETLKICSFKGVNFIWRSTTLDTGNAYKTNEYVKSEGTSKPQFLGRRKTSFIVTLEPIEQTIKGNSELLRALATDNGEGELQLPDYPKFNCVVTNVTVNNNMDLINKYTYNVTFLETKKLIFPVTKNTGGSLQNNEKLTREKIITNLLDKVNNVNLASIQGTLTNLISGNIYDFINNNALLSAIRNVDEIITTANTLIKGTDKEATNSSIGARGSPPNTEISDALNVDKDLILSRITTPQSVVEIVGDLYTELANVDFFSAGQSINIFVELGSLHFPLQNKIYTLLQDKNAETLEYYNRKLALLQVCVLTTKKIYSLQEDIEQDIANILALQESLLNFTTEDIIEINIIVNNALDLLKTQKSSLYKTSKAKVFNAPSLEISYILFNNIDDNLDIIKYLNPDLDYGALSGEINIVENND